jgi:hypothetical protein
MCVRGRRHQQLQEIQSGVVVPLALAMTLPAPVRSRIKSRSNSAIPANTVRIILPALEFAALALRSRDLLPEDALASRFLERGEL